MKKRFVLVMCLAIAMLLAICVPAQAAGHPAFYLEKVCDGSVAPDVCVITTATPFTVLTGGQIKYFDHAYFQNPAGVIIESATVLVTASDGSQMTGHVRWINDRGYFTFLPGTGVFKNIHVTGMVNVVSWDTYTFSLSGEYFFTP